MLSLLKVWPLTSSVTNITSPSLGKKNVKLSEFKIL